MYGQIEQFLNLQWSLVEKEAMDLSNSFTGEFFIERVLTYFSSPYSGTVFNDGIMLRGSLRFEMIGIYGSS